METRSVDLTEDVVKTELHRTELAVRRKLAAEVGDYEYLRKTGRFRTAIPKENYMELYAAHRRLFLLPTEYLNLKLRLETWRQMDAHIDGCPPCVEFAQSLRTAMEPCRRYEPLQMPQPLHKEALDQMLQAFLRKTAHPSQCWLDEPVFLANATS